MNTVQWHKAAEELRVLTERVVKASRRDTERRLAASEAGISGLQYGILRILTDQEYSISELSRLVQREPATLVPVVDALEEKGLLRRGVDANDRRRTPLAITEGGAQVLRRLPLVDENDSLAAALEEMGERSASHLLELMRLLVEQLSEPMSKHRPNG